MVGVGLHEGQGKIRKKKKVIGPITRYNERFKTPSKMCVKIKNVFFFLKKYFQSILRVY